MRVMWLSNAPWAGTGYGVQTKYAMEYLPPLGHAFAVACNYGLAGARLEAPGPDGGEGVRFYPNGYEKNSLDVVQAHADNFKADVLISLYDVFPLKIMDLRTPWLPWTMVDHEPLISTVADVLRGEWGDGKPHQPATRPVACSEFGLKQMQEAGFGNAAYIPLGTDLSIYRPGNQAEARERLGLPDGAWIAGMVAANKSYPTRKNFPQVIAAWAEFKKRHPDAVLYLHTEQYGYHGGIDLMKLIQHFGLTANDVRICDPYQEAIGFPDPYMVDVYNALDCLLSPSMSEGFGVPIVEAQACGTPVIACENSSMPELVKSGFLVSRTDCERWWHPQGGWDFIPHEGALVETMELMYRNPLKSAQLHDEMRPYDWQTSIAPAWDALLKETAVKQKELAAYGL